MAQRKADVVALVAGTAAVAAAAAAAVLVAEDVIC
jgi:hypothetical protein